MYIYTYACYKLYKIMLYDHDTIKYSIFGECNYTSAKIIELAMTYIYMLNKNTPGVKKSEAKSEAPVSIHACD